MASSARSTLYNRTHALNEDFHRVSHNGVSKLKQLTHEPKLLQKSSSTSTSSSQPVYYATIFERVFKTRLSYFKRICAVISFILCVLITLIGSGASFFMLPIKMTFMFGSFILMESARELSIVVDYNPRYKTFISQAIGELASKRFLNTVMAVLVASFIYFSVLYAQMRDEKFIYYVTSPTRAIKPFFNDEFVFYCFHCILLALLYSIQHCVLLKNKLNFKFGIAKTDPKESIFKGQILFLKESIFLTIVSSIGSQILYSLLRPFIYKICLYPLYWPLGLNQKMPLSKVSFAMSFFLFVADALIIYTWNLVNHVFSVYSTVGCISAGKTLSSFSKDPANSLLSGLRDTKRPLVRLTAFQELAFIAASPDQKLREFLYNSHFKNDYMWQSVLQECRQVIEETSIRIKCKPIRKMGVNQPSSQTPKTSIFGNSKSSSIENKDSGIANYSLKSANLAPPKKKSLLTLPSMTNENMEPIDLKQLLGPYLKKLEQHFMKLSESSLGKPFRSTLRREANCRVVNPVNYGNAILSISYIALSAEYEDKKNVVMSTLPEILALLEKAVSATKSFIDYPPVETTVKAKNTIEVLHDLSMRLFFELVIKYNHMLNDFALSHPVFDLSKWCIDLAIEQQKEEQQNQRMKKF